MMMGIKSQLLYDALTAIVIGNDLTILDKLEPSVLLKELCYHMNTSIPLKIFHSNVKDYEIQVIKINKVCDYLQENFIKVNAYPFTIQRICELCYHPLEYFKIDELFKFVNAIERCCFVKSYWKDEFGGSKSDSQVSDISMTKISWLHENENKNLTQFINKIESIVSINFGYDEDEKHTEDHNIIMDEYYEDEDGDYIDDETFAGNDNQNSDYNDNYNDDQNDDQCTNQNSDNDDDDDDDDQFSQRKRKPIDIDNYKYEVDETVKESAFTPKKSKVNTAKDDNIIHIISPLISQISESPTEQQTPTLVSPSTDKSIDEEQSAKDTNLNMLLNEHSPLSYKTRR